MEDEDRNGRKRESASILQDYQLEGEHILDRIIGSTTPEHGNEYFLGDLLYPSRRFVDREQQHLPFKRQSHFLKQRHESEVEQDSQNCQ